MWSPKLYACLVFFSVNFIITFAKFHYFPSDSCHTPKDKSRLDEPDYVNLPPTRDFTPIKFQLDYSQNTTLSPSRSYDSALNNIKDLEQPITPVKDKYGITLHSPIYVMLCFCQI